MKNIEIAASKFREKGILGASLKDLLSLAGVSQGAFYYHFLSKEHLVREAVVSALDHQRGIWELALKEGGAGFEGEVRRRLSQDYRDRPEQDSPRATLAAEIARHSKETRLEIEQKADQLLQLLADNLPGPKTRAKRQEAIAIYALMIGILQLSRVAASPRLSAEILESGLAHVIEQLRRRVDTNSGTTALTVEQPTPSGKHQTHTEL